MSISNERDTDLLVREYGSSVLAVEGISCYHNALKASMSIFIESHGEYLPRIWGVDIPELNDHHAYLEHGGLVFNKRITWPDSKYPDFSLQQLRKVGMDNTTNILLSGMEELLEISESESLGFGTLLRGAPYDEGMTVFSVLLAVELSRGVPYDEALSKIIAGSQH